MKWMFFLLIFILPFVIASENITHNETNISFGIENLTSDINFTTSQISEDENSKILTTTTTEILSFFISSYSSGEIFSFDWFELLLTSGAFTGDEYSGNFYIDMIETPNVVASGSEYSFVSGSLGLLSIPAQEVVVIDDEVPVNVEPVSSGGSNGESRGCREGYLEVGGICVRQENKTEEVKEVEVEETKNESLDDRVSDEDFEGAPEEEGIGTIGRIIERITENIEGFALILTLLFILFALWRIKKYKSKKKEKKKRRLMRVLKRSHYQTGSTNLGHDRRVSALAPGKRVSKRGKVYYETRMNHSDKNGKTTSLEK